MAVIIPWNQHEQAVLLHALIKVLNHEVKRKQAVAEVSTQLRDFAIAQGISIDEKFRNENGIALQMNRLKYVFTGGKSGLPVKTGWYFEIVQLYKNDQEKYKKLLGEVMEVLASKKAKNVSFSTWIKSNSPERADRILSLLNILSILLLKNKVIHSGILQIEDIKAIESLINQIRLNKGINIHSGKKKAQYIEALNTYRSYLQYLQNKIDNKQTEFAQKEIEQQNLKKCLTNELPFYNWLIQNQGMAEATGHGYNSAINTADDFARKHNLGHGTIRGVTDVTSLSETLKALSQNVEFAELNRRQHNRFYAAFRKYLQYVREINAASKGGFAHIVADPFKDVDFSPYKKILSKSFPKGFRIESRLDMQRFRAFWKDEFGTDIDENDESIRKHIAHITIRCQDFVYLPEMMASEQTTDKLLSYLTKCFQEGKTAVYFDALYTEFQQDFIGKHINNPEMLKNYLSFISNGRFFIHKNYLTAEANVDVNPADEIRNYLITAGTPVKIENLQKELSHIDKDIILGVVSGPNSAEFVRNRKGEYFHADVINFTQQELDTITKLIQQAIDDKNYMGGKELTDTIEIKLPAIKERYPFLTWLGMRDVIAYKLQNSFSFKGKIISSYGYDLSMSDVFAHFASTHSHFTLEQLNYLKQDLGTPIYFDSVYENSLRINKDEFVSRDQASFNTEETDIAIGRFFIGDYIPLREINFFGSFPSAGFPWNGFLLQHYVAYFSKKFKLLHTGFNASKPVGAIVKRTSNLENFDELLSTELAASKISLDTESALQYLVDIGLLARKCYKGIEQILSKAKLQRSMKG